MSRPHTIEAINFDKGNPQNMTFPAMRTHQRRMDTFTLGWKNHQLSASTREIASADFFAINRRRAIKCFACGVGTNLGMTQDPFLAHAIINPQCKFLISQKGKEYIEQILRGNLAIFGRPGENKCNRDLFSTPTEMQTGGEKEEENSKLLDKNVTENQADDNPRTAKSPRSSKIRNEVVENPTESQDHMEKGMCSYIENAINATATPINKYSPHSKKEIDGLQNEMLKRIIRQKICVSCNRHIATVLILPCHHISLCKTCRFHWKTCPKCNQVAAEFWTSA